MELKVIRYINYGWTDGSPDEDQESSLTSEVRFYFSFYELNTGKIMCLNLIEYWKKNKFIDDQFDYSSHSAGEYTFGMDFREWWDSTFERTYEDYVYPSDEEQSCVKACFRIYLDDKRDFETGVVLIQD